MTVETDCGELISMLTYCRPANSKSEKRFIKRFLKPLGLKQDGFGNLFKRIGTDPIMWSCHTDTVHDNGGHQKLGFDKNVIGVREGEKSSCLGADDTAGVWLMVQMMRHERSGLYIFHREEECGRNGSRHVAKTYGEELKKIKFAIALDRRGTESIITHQLGDRCCSDEFTESLAEQLKPMTFKGDDTGSFTDTASYVDLIGECTNLSVGYSSAHTKYERLDTDHLFDLREQLLGLDVSKLVEKRKAGEVEKKTPAISYGGRGYYDEWGFCDPTGHYNRYTHKEPGDHLQNRTTTYLDKVWGTTSTAKQSNMVATAGDDDDGGSYTSGEIRTLTRIIERNPEAVAFILESYGANVKDIEDEIMQMYGVVNY